MIAIIILVYVFHVSGLSAGGTLAAGVAKQLVTLNNIHSNETSPLPKLLVLVNAPLQALSLRLPSIQHNAYNAFQTRASYIWFLGNYLFGSQRYYNKLWNNRHVPDDVLQRFETEVFKVLPDDEIKRNYELETTLSFMDIFRKTLSQIRKRYISKFIYSGKTEKRNEKQETEKPDSGVNKFWSDNKHLFLDESAFPLMARNFSYMPKTHIYHCYWDILRDDSVLYAHKLRKAGIDVTEVSSYKCHHLWNVFQSLDEHNSNMFDDLVANIAKDL